MTLRVLGARAKALPSGKRARPYGMSHGSPRARTLRPPDPNEGRDLFLEIRAGTGGEEAALFAADLCRMYLRYAERKRWRVSARIA